MSAKGGAGTTRQSASQPAQQGAGKGATPCTGSGEEGRKSFCSSSMCVYDSRRQEERMRRTRKHSKTGSTTSETESQVGRMATSLTPTPY